MHTSTQRQSAPRVAVVGGGASGAASAAHIAGAFDPALDLEVRIFDPGGTLGRGIAYSTTDEQHLLNVPAKGMSLYRDDMEHFQRWAAAGPDEFVTRSRYGDYLQHCLRSDWRRRNGRLVHVRDRIVDLLQTPDGWLLLGAEGRHHVADVVILATGHLPPSSPAEVSKEVASAPGYHVDPWSRQALAGLRQGEHVLCLGTGLTFVDVALSVLADRPDVKVTGLSRRGRLPSRHLTPLTRPRPPMRLPQSGRVDLEKVIEHILAAGPDWRGAVDGMRGQTPEIWQRLCDADREYYIRHLARDWDVLRHRMAPQVADAVRNERAGGRLMVEAATAYRIDRIGSQFSVITRDKALLVDRIIVCTGPRADARLTELGTSLVRRGVAQPGPFAIGYGTDPATGQILGADGGPVNGLFAIGPLRRGVLFESTAMPEIAAQAQQLACDLARRSVVLEAL